MSFANNQLQSANIDTQAGLRTTEAQAWFDRAPQLADWALARLANRADCYGGYRPEKQIGKEVKGRDGETRTLGSQRTVKNKLTRTDFIRHFRCGTEREHILGLHAASKENTCKGGAIDIDYHGLENNAPEVNLRAAVAWYDALTAKGFRPLLTDSNGAGGFHLRLLLAEPVPADRVFWFLKTLTADHASLGFDKAPETFPKQADVRLCDKGFGNWLRLPGRHHKREHWSRVWDGSGWLSGTDAIDFILALTGDPVTLIPENIVPVASEVAQRGATNFVPGTARADDLDQIQRRAARYVSTMEPSIEGGRGSDQTFKVAARLVQGFDLSPSDAFPVLKEYSESRCDPPWSDAELWKKLNDAAAKPGVRGELLNADRQGYASKAADHDEWWRFPCPVVVRWGRLCKFVLFPDGGFAVLPADVLPAAADAAPADALPEVPASDTPQPVGGDGASLDVQYPQTRPGVLETMFPPETPEEKAARKEARLLIVQQAAESGVYVAGTSPTHHHPCPDTNARAAQNLAKDLARVNHFRCRSLICPSCRGIKQDHYKASVQYHMGQLRPGTTVAVFTVEGLRNWENLYESQIRGKGKFVKLQLDAAHRWLVITTVAVTGLAVPPEILVPQEAAARFCAAVDQLPMLHHSPYHGSHKQRGEHGESGWGLITELRQEMEGWENQEQIELPWQEVRKILNRHGIEPRVGQSSERFWNRQYQEFAYPGQDKWRHIRAELIRGEPLSPEDVDIVMYRRKREETPVDLPEPTTSWRPGIDFVDVS